MQESSGVASVLESIASDHLFGGRVTCSETQEAEGSVVLPSGADSSTEQQTKGADPRTGTLKSEMCRFPLALPCPGWPCRALLALGSLVLLLCPGGFLSVFFVSSLACGSFFLFPQFFERRPKYRSFLSFGRGRRVPAPKGRDVGSNARAPTQVPVQGTVPRNGFFWCPTLRIFYLLPSYVRGGVASRHDCALKCVGDVFPQYLVTGHFRLFSVSSSCGCLDTNTRKYMHCPVSIVLFWFASGRTTGIAMVSAASAAITFPIGKA